MRKPIAEPDVIESDVYGLQSPSKPEYCICEGSYEKDDESKETI